jgi:hypothetical protein
MRPKDRTPPGGSGNDWKILIVSLGIMGLAGAIVKILMPRVRIRVRKDLGIQTIELGIGSNTHHSPNSGIILLNTKVKDG